MNIKLLKARWTANETPGPTQAPESWGGPSLLWAALLHRVRRKTPVNKDQHTGRANRGVVKEDSGLDDFVGGLQFKGAASQGPRPLIAKAAEGRGTRRGGFR